MELLLNEYPYSDYQKINLDWLLDLGNKLKADAESGAFNGADGEQGERGYGVYGGNVTITSYSEPVGGTIVTYPYTVLKTAVQNAAVNDFIVGNYNGLVIIFKVNVDVGDRLAGFTALTLTGPQGPQGEPGEGGLTEAMKQALLQLARKVAYIDGNGQTYYNALYTAFYGGTPVPVVVLDYISAVFNQGSTVVYDTDTLDSLKSMLTVTAHYSDNTTSNVPSTDYTLSGTLTVGTSTITASYSGKTDTFDVTVTHYTQSYVMNGLVAMFDAIDNTGSGHDGGATTWTDLIGNYDITVPSGKATWDNNALVLDGSQGSNIYPLTAWPNSATRTVEMVIMPTSISTNVIANVGKEGGGRCLYLLSNENSVAVFNSSEKAYVNPLSALSDIRQLSVSYSGNYTTSHVFINGQETTTRGPTNHTISNTSSNLIIGAQGGTGNYTFVGKIYAIRIYDRVLTVEEVAQNLSIDAVKYGLVI